MYFYQACEGIESYAKERDEPDFTQYTSEFLKTMMTAQRFHLGDFWQLLETGMAPGRETTFFKGQWGESINIPFENIWLDFQSSNSDEGYEPKGGALIVGDTNGGPFTIHPMVVIGGSWLPPMGKIDVENGEMEFHIRQEFAHLKGAGMAFDYTRREVAAVNCFLKLINCKNIEADKVEPSAKLNKKRMKKGKKPFLSYKVLTLKLPGKGNGSTSITHTGVKQRVHVCRGHYKTYTEDKPLMGKITGTFWWQPSIRGSKKNGAVIKDYKVKTD